MNRRATLATLLGRRPTKRQRATVADIHQRLDVVPQVNSGLDPYTGPFEFEQAAHLLRRTTYGPSREQIEQAVTLGLQGTLAKLFADQPLPDPPLNFSNEEDPFVPIGETWIDAPYVPGANLQGPRNQSLRAWQMGVILNEGTSIREKLVTFWHNHYVTGGINDPKFVYRYITLFRNNPWGNFRELTKAVTIDPAMLRYLNGNQNTAAAPNENYARELLELFTIGKGPVAGPGDYTNYTEQDVVQMARVLTGWRDVGYFTTNPNIEVGSVFIPGRHDVEAKVLSHRFDNAVITNMGDQEYAHLIDIIFSKDEVARFICRKFYRWFVYYVITEEVEANVIEPMAQILISNDYEVRPALEALLGSEHFFDMLNVGPMIKNPLDFVMSLAKSTRMEFPTELQPMYRHWLNLFRGMAFLQMEYFFPPSVAGWPAYYQEPSFFRLWINSVTLPIRMEISTLLANNGIAGFGARTRMDVLQLVATVSDPFDPNVVISDFARLFFPQPITDAQHTFLKEVLLPGLPDFEWTLEYTDYVNDPTNEEKAQAVDSKLRNLLTAMFSMPEFQLS